VPILLLTARDALGLRYVALGGMILVAAACLVLTQVSVGGSYFADLFLGLLLFGTGLGATLVASQIAGLSGVVEQESGLAAGLVDSSFNVGSALDIAVLSTVAVARTNDVLAGAGPTSPDGRRHDRGLSDRVPGRAWDRGARRPPRIGVVTARPRGRGYGHHSDPHGHALPGACERDAGAQGRRDCEARRLVTVR
jgi:hypothetical protein